MVQGRIMKRLLLGQPANESSAEQSGTFDAPVDVPPLRPITSQNTWVRLENSITCIDKSSNRNYAIVAGEDVFKTIKVDGSTISEEIDLRGAISAQGSAQDDALSTLKDRLSIKSVAWSHGELDTTIVAASANGLVNVYDLNRIVSGVEVGRIKEHTRQVHKLAISPFRANWLLTACQDGTVRLLDIKSAAGRSGHQFHNWSVFQCNADAVRDVKWSPSDGFKFACSTASGTVLHWDTRKTNAPILKLNAHDSVCLSISWHPDGEHLISAGIDQKCHVWHLGEKAEKRQKPKYTVNTPAPVKIVSWRPACWSSTAQAKRAAQIAVVYDDANAMRIQNSTVHIWDVARPGLPFKEITWFESSPTGLLWHERDMLWTVGREGYFTQTDVAFAAKVIDRRSLSTFDFSPSGEALMLLEERQDALRRRPHQISPMAVSISAQPRTNDSHHQSPNAAQLSISRSDSEEDISGSFLGPRPRNKQQGQRQNSRTTSTLSTTPPSINSVDTTIMKLDDAVKITGPYKPQQTMAVGQAPSATRRDVYEYLSSRYMQRLPLDLGERAFARPIDPPLCDRLQAILEHFAKSAEGVGQFRMAQTWRILSYTMSLLLNRRAHHHRELRLTWHEERRAEREKRENEKMNGNRRQSEQYLQDFITPRKLGGTKSPAEGLMRPGMKSILTEEIESTSNMTTPQARPVRDSLVNENGTSAEMSAIDKDRLELPPAAQSAKMNPIKIPQLFQKAEEVDSPMSGYDLYGMSSPTRLAIGIATPQRKAPLRLDLNMRDVGAPLRAAMLARHDSNESFQGLSTSDDSYSRDFPSSSDSVDRESLPKTTHRAVPDVESSWHSSEASSDRRPNRSFEYDDMSNQSIDYEYNSPNFGDLPPTSRIPRLGTDGAQEYENGDNEALNPSGVQYFRESKYDSLDILDSDYLPGSSDPRFLPSPIDPHLLVQKIIQFETKTGSLSASFIILLFKPLLSPGTLDDIQCAAILRQYHHRLHSMMLFTEAALLRKLCYPTYPSVYSQGQSKNVGSMGYYCKTCEKPVQEGNLALGQRLQKCYRCNTYFDGCAICNLREELPPIMNEGLQNFDSKGGLATGIQSMNVVIDPSSPAANLWWWCQGCGHGGHTACMRTWHSSDGEEFSDGCCPLEGCLHPCLPGKWRDEFLAGKNAVKNVEMTKLVKESTRGGPKGVRAGVVKRDSSEVLESRAVESVRGALGAAKTERERRRSVKVVAPGEK